MEFLLLLRMLLLLLLVHPPHPAAAAYDPATADIALDGAIEKTKNYLHISTTNHHVCV
jgi:hypothetical protein